MNKLFLLSFFKKNIARFHSSIVFSSFYQAARFYIVCFENGNPNFETNGEKKLWERIKKINFKTVFDVGANEGYWSIGVSKELNPNFIFAFEPIQSTYIKLENNVRYYNIKTFSIALGDITGQIEMKICEEKSFLSSSVMIDRNSSSKIVNCKIEKGDLFCEKNKISEIDFLKIDTEGNDFKVLKGFENLLVSKRIRMIQFEYGPFAIYTKDLLKDFYDYLCPFGYIIGKIYPDCVHFREYHNHHENFILSNFIAIKSSDFELFNNLIGKKQQSNKI